MDDAAENKSATRKFPIVASVIALVGFFDSLYLTVQHYTGEKVPCSVTGGCEMVLGSAWSEIAGIPLAVFGAAAYFTAFSLAVLSFYGHRLTWKMFGLLASSMALFSGYLVYVQAFRIGAFCQFCLLSAATSVTLFLIAVFSRFWRG